MQFIRLYTILILLLGVPMLGTAQEVSIQKSTEKIRVDGQVCFIHNVKKGETIYSLCKVYGVSNDDLLKYNPQLADGLKEGQVLRIPEVKPIAAGEPMAVVPAGTRTHEVKRKETLFSISQLYSCTVDDLKRLNPTIGDDIQKGQLIYVPINASKPTVAAATTPQYSQPDPQKGNNLYHLVKKGETLYSIATQYAISEADLKAGNQDAFANGQLMEGAVLRIAKSKAGGQAGETTTATTTTTYPIYTDPKPGPIVNNPRPASTYEYSKGETFNVAYLLPLYKDLQRKVSEDGEVMSNGSKRTDFVEFYEGALLALDSLRQLGVSVNVCTFDASDSKSLTEAINSTEVANAQLIIAPVSDDRLKQLSDFALQKQIPVVIALGSLSDSALMANPYLIQLKTQKNSIRERLFENICQPNRNVVLVKNGERDAELYAYYHKQLEASGCKFRTMSYAIMRSRSTLDAMLEDGRENHIIVAVDNNVSFVTDFLETLNLLTVKNRSNTYVYGTSRWRGMESLKVSTLYNVNLRVSQAFFTDYTSAETKRFIAKYRYFYKGEPSSYSLLGYDATLYFLQCLKTYGTNFMHYLPEKKGGMLQSNFVFKQVENGGMKNQGAFMLEYQPTLDIIRK